jgi:hypothetical protein
MSSTQLQHLLFRSLHQKQRTVAACVVDCSVSTHPAGTTALINARVPQQLPKHNSSWQSGLYKELCLGLCGQQRQRAGLCLRFGKFGGVVLVEVDRLTGVLSGGALGCVYSLDGVSLLVPFFAAKGSACYPPNGQVAVMQYT